MSVDVRAKKGGAAEGEGEVVAEMAVSYANNSIEVLQLSKESHSKVRVAVRTNKSHSKVHCPWDSALPHEGLSG